MSEFDKYKGLLDQYQLALSAPDKDKQISELTFKMDRVWKHLTEKERNECLVYARTLYDKRIG